METEKQIELYFCLVPLRVFFISLLSNRLSEIFHTLIIIAFKAYFCS